MARRPKVLRELDQAREKIDAKFKEDMQKQDDRMHEIHDTAIKRFTRDRDVMREWQRMLKNKEYVTLAAAMRLWELEFDRQREYWEKKQAEYSSRTEFVS